MTGRVVITAARFSTVHASNPTDQVSEGVRLCSTLEITTPSSASSSTAQPVWPALADAGSDLGNP
jgi:hypothetical protein